MPVDRATHRRIKNQILKAIHRGVQVNGKFVFKRSQEYVPVSTGFLKKSGGFAAKKDGWILKYNAPYAADVENRPYSSDDTEKPKAIGPRIRKAFRRKDGTQVKATKVKGYYTSPSGKRLRRDPRQGGQYLSRAADMEMPDLTQNVFNALKRQFGKAKLSSSTGGKPKSSGGNPTSSSGGKPQAQGSKYKNRFGGKK